MKRLSTPSKRVTLPADPWARAQVEAMDKLRAKNQKLESALLQAWKLVHPGDREFAMDAWRIVEKLERRTAKVGKEKKR